MGRDCSTVQTADIREISEAFHRWYTGLISQSFYLISSAEAHIYIRLSSVRFYIQNKFQRPSCETALWGSTDKTLFCMTCSGVYRHRLNLYAHRDNVLQGMILNSGGWNRPNLFPDTLRLPWNFLLGWLFLFSISIFWKLAFQQCFFYLPTAYETMTGPSCKMCS